MDGVLLPGSAKKKVMGWEERALFIRVSVIARY